MNKKNSIIRGYLDDIFKMGKELACKTIATYPVNAVNDESLVKVK